jgi:hypothetical protein
MKQRPPTEAERRNYCRLAALKTADSAARLQTRHQYNRHQPQEPQLVQQVALSKADEVEGEQEQRELNAI